MSVISRDVLLTHFVGGTANPICGVSTAVAKNGLKRLVFGSHVLKRSLLIESNLGGEGTSIWGRIEILNNNAIHVSCGHTESVYFGWNMPGVA
jgi:hypothetical protein